MGRSTIFFAVAVRLDGSCSLVENPDWFATRGGDQLESVDNLQSFSVSESDTHPRNCVEYQNLNRLRRHFDMATDCRRLGELDSSLARIVDVRKGNCRKNSLLSFYPRIGRHAVDVIDDKNHPRSHCLGSRQSCLGKALDKNRIAQASSHTYMALGTNCDKDLSGRHFQNFGHKESTRAIHCRVGSHHRCMTMDVLDSSLVELWRPR